ncbi:hypothetical protein CBR_g39513 [Chara braunii]|uniref:Uncharacterized protein n=1 Tax=Chara braunii TaxID=69332 RepID=A0A388LRT3_CHABU|nr:hypothetical protein CBR_g39513 [Chara braunii]|eukprot:GBG85050.1 hypothetical protein CBR_g39513 [Chara braunii]
MSSKGRTSRAVLDLLPVQGGTKASAEWGQLGQGFSTIHPVLGLLHVLSDNSSDELREANKGKTSWGQVFRSSCLCKGGGRPPQHGEDFR